MELCIYARKFPGQPVYVLHTGFLTVACFPCVQAKTEVDQKQKLRSEAESAAVKAAAKEAEVAKEAEAAEPVPFEKPVSCLLLPAPAHLSSLVHPAEQRARYRNCAFLRLAESVIARTPCRGGYNTCPGGSAAAEGAQGEEGGAGGAAGAGPGPGGAGPYLRAAGNRAAPRGGRPQQRR